mmetsp:Transcript_8283/g.18515  ORF Transcript_8283/g.18515 Transcript_8283/m.18515 type:complete len:145 (-) Transcript_8283:301-735(-)
MIIVATSMQQGCGKNDACDQHVQCTAAQYMAPNANEAHFVFDSMYRCCSHNNRSGASLCTMLAKQACHSPVPCAKCKQQCAVATQTPEVHARSRFQQGADCILMSPLRRHHECRGLARRPCVDSDAVGQALADAIDIAMACVDK